MSNISKPTYGNHIIQSPKDYSLCTGCTTCEMACSLVHDGRVSPSYCRIRLQAGPIKTMEHMVLTCQQCNDHPCYDACPKKDDAMRIDDNGIVYIVEEACIGCGMCQRRCKFTPSRINMVSTKNKAERKAKKCDLCRGRAEGPACIQWCPAMCLALSDGPIPWESNEEGVCK